MLSHVTEIMGVPYVNVTRLRHVDAGTLMSIVDDLIKYIGQRSNLSGNLIR